MSYEELRAESRKKLRSELISEAYEDYPPDPRILAQIRRLDEEDYQFQCPVCRQKIATLDLHLQTQTGKGHVRYRSNMALKAVESSTDERTSSGETVGNSCPPDPRILAEIRCIDEEDKEDDQFQCSVCKQKITSQSLLDSHLQTHQKGKGHVRCRDSMALKSTKKSTASDRKSSTASGQRSIRDFFKPSA